jgi:protein-S-isoprenylcysteine O-methyltransferase Ste14
MSSPKRGLLAPALLLVACAGLALQAVHELQRIDGAAPVLHAMRALTIALLVAWLLLEAPLSMRVATDDQRGDDRGTVVWNALSRALALVTALALPPIWAAGWNLVQSLGLALFVAGFTLRLLAIRQLGRFYSHKVRRTDGHEVIDSGPYRLVRHPAYLGVIAAHLGFAVVFLNAASLAAVLLLVIPAFVRRILIEEPVLMRIPGYAEYARGRARLVPRLW